MLPQNESALLFLPPPPTPAPSAPAPFSSRPFADAIQVRETAVGMIAVNTPVLVPLFSKAFWTRGPYRPGRQPGQAQGAGVFGNHGNRRRPADAPRPTVFQIPSEMTWTTQGVSLGTSEQTELSKLSKISRPGNTRDLEKGPDTMSGAVEMQAVERRTEQGQDDMAISPARAVD